MVQEALGGINMTIDIGYGFVVSVNKWYMKRCIHLTNSLSRSVMQFSIATVRHLQQLVE